MAPQTDFTIDAPVIDPDQTLLVGLAAPGMASLTTVNHIVDNHETEEIGHISPTELPSITPFEEGTPRHHTRLYNLVETDFVVLVSELFVPPWAARPFARTILEWCERTQIGEVTMLHPVFYEHGPDDHAVFYIATEEYMHRRLTGEIPPMPGGFLDGVPGELVSHSLEDAGPPTGIFVTPAHPPGPDIDAALLFLDALETVYEFEVERAELEDLSREIKTHYESLAERMEALEQSNQQERDFYADRMYM